MREGIRMLKRLRIQGFKSLIDVEVEFPALTVLFGPNAVGKSNLLDALLVLSRLATERTLGEALSDPVRGYPVESFTFPKKGLPALLEKEQTRLVLEVDVGGREEGLLRYRITVAIHPRSGSLSVVDEYLVRLNKTGLPVGTPTLDVVDGEIRIRRKSKPAHPRTEPIGLNHTQLSDPRFSGLEYQWIERARKELSAFRTYYLDPRVAMRRAAPPKEVTDIGPLGENLAPFLYRLRSSEEYRRHFDQIVRTVRSIIPAVESLTVDLDEKRGTLDIQIVQDGVTFPSRIVSEGTLRVLALAAIAANPWPGSLVAFEEPENGVHPRRLELIARLLGSLAIEQGLQVIVTTHSPLFCQQILAIQREYPEKVTLLACRQENGATQCLPFEPTGPLFEDQEVRATLTSRQEDGWFEGLVLRGLVDG